MTFCMPVGDGKVFWRRMPTNNLIDALNEGLKENNVLRATHDGVETTFLYDWDEWEKMKLDLNLVASFAKNHHNSLKGGFLFYRGNESGGDILPVGDYGERWMLRNGVAKKSKSGKVYPCRKINRDYTHAKNRANKIKQKRDLVYSGKAPRTDTYYEYPEEEGAAGD